MKNKLKISPLSALTITASAAVVMYYLIYLLLCLAGVDSRLMALFALFVMAIAALPVVFAKQLQGRLKSAFKPLQIVFTVLLWVYLISVLVFWCYIGINAGRTPESYAESRIAQNDTGADTVIMVFGCRTYGYTPSLTLRLRLEAAHQLLTALPDAMCIVSGGQGTNETVPESHAMAAYLVNHGISEDRIIKEENSHSTSENIRLTKELISDMGLEHKKIIGVSTGFHLPRIAMLSERYGLPMELCASPSPSLAHHYVSMIREYLSYIKMALFDEAVIITKVT